MAALTAWATARTWAQRPTTVATYKARLFDKLGVSNLLDLQRLAQLHGYHTS